MDSVGPLLICMFSASGTDTEYGHLTYQFWPYHPLYTFIINRISKFQVDLISSPHQFALASDLPTHGKIDAVNDGLCPTLLSAAASLSHTAVFDFLLKS